MRALLLAAVLATTLALPGALGATFDLGASKVIERALEPGADIAFEMPLKINQDGLLYGKVLPTPGNAVNDGTRANGSLADGSGWRVSFALVRASGERVELGTFVDSTVSQLAPIANGETPTFVATVHVPSDAARGGPQQRVYVAIAYRLDGGSARSTSGGVIDEARSLTLILSNALLPPAVGDPSSPSPAPTTAAPTAPTPAPAASGEETQDPTTSGPDPTESTEIPAVAPISGSAPIRVQVAPLPVWFLGGALAVGAGLVLVLALMTLAIFTLARAQRREVRPLEIRTPSAEAESRRIEVVPAREE